MGDKIAEKLRKKLTEAVGRNPAEGLLFSGGLDSAILAFLCPGIKAITVTLDSSGEDLEYAQRLTEHCQIKFYHRKVSTDEAIAAIPEVIRILKSFDPAIPNDITVYFGLKEAQQMGIKNAMSGDGSDELLAGYEFMRELPYLKKYLRKMSFKMSFSSNTIADAFHLGVRQPYLDEKFIDFCRNLPVNFKLRRTGANVVGKWILRKAFEDSLPKDIIWQDKRPLEHGSGTTKLRKILASTVSDNEYKIAKRVYPVKFMNKEHLYYYKIYRKEVGKVPEALPGENVCPGCGAALKKRGWHCWICGWTKKI